MRNLLIGPGTRTTERNVPSFADFENRFWDSLYVLNGILALYIWSATRQSRAAALPVCSTIGLAQSPSWITLTGLKCISLPYIYKVSSSRLSSSFVYPLRLKANNQDALVVRPCLGRTEICLASLRFILTAAVYVAGHPDQWMWFLWPSTHNHVLLQYNPFRIRPGPTCSKPAGKTMLNLRIKPFSDIRIRHTTSMYGRQSRCQSIFKHFIIGRLAIKVVMWCGSNAIWGVLSDH